MRFLDYIRRLFGKSVLPVSPTGKSIAFIDGDQNRMKALVAYDLYLQNVESVLVYCNPIEHLEPRILRKRNTFLKVCLTGYSVGKEVTDKYITAAIQKAISDNYTDITVVSSDYDFIDIFTLMMSLNPDFTGKFRYIAPEPNGRVATLPAQIANIEVIKL